MSSSLSFLQEAVEIREVDSNELKRDALKVDVEDEDNDVDADENIALVVLRSSERIFEYSSVLIRTFRDDRIPFKESGDATPTAPMLRPVLVDVSDVVETAGGNAPLCPLLVTGPARDA